MNTKPLSITLGDIDKTSLFSNANDLDLSRNLDVHNNIGNSKISQPATFSTFNVDTEKDVEQTRIIAQRTTMPQMVNNDLVDEISWSCDHVIDEDRRSDRNIYDETFLEFDRNVTSIPSMNNSKNSVINNESYDKTQRLELAGHESETFPALNYLKDSMISQMVMKYDVIDEVKEDTKDLFDEILLKNDHNVGFLSKISDSKNSVASCESYGQSECSELKNDKSIVRTDDNHEDSADTLNDSQDVSLRRDENNAVFTSVHELPVKEDASEKTVKCEIFSSNTCILNNNIKHDKKNAHPKGKKYKCDRCLSMFSFNWNLKQHINNVHENKKNYHCTFCTKTYKSYYGMKGHIKTVHPECLKKYDDLVIKLTSSVKEENEQFTCSTCHRIFDSLIGLNHHRVVHIKKRKLECSICKKLLSSEVYLEKHIQKCHP